MSVRWSRYVHVGHRRSYGDLPLRLSTCHVAHRGLTERAQVRGVRYTVTSAARASEVTPRRRPQVETR